MKPILKQVEQKLINEEAKDKELGKNNSELSSLVQKAFKDHSKAESAPLIKKLTRAMKNLQAKSIQIGYKKGVTDALTEVSNDFEVFDFKSLEPTEEEERELERMMQEAMEMDIDEDLFNDEAFTIGF